MSSATVADEFKMNFYTAVRDLMEANQDTAAVLVCYGAPGTFEPQDIISVQGIRSDQAQATFGTSRSREETLQLEVQLSCVRGGGQEAEIAAAQRAYQLLRVIEQHFRQTDTTVGGTVRQCFLIGHTSSGQTDPTLLEQGRVIEITATFQAQARIT